MSKKRFIGRQPNREQLLAVGHQAGLPAGRLSGLTLLELLIIMVMLAVIMTSSIPIFISFKDHTKVQRAMMDLRTISQAVDMYFLINGQWPPTIDDIGYGKKSDPWGLPYQYLRIETATAGMVRKNRFLVPINTYYDLYSMGPDGNSQPPLTADDSRDDIIRANDGGFIGLASKY